MRRFLLLSTLSITFFLAAPMPKAQAIDPVTIAILAPIALKAANAAQPYIIKGLVNGGRQFVRIGSDMIDLMLLPWGFMQATVGAPFGGLGPGLANIIRGGMAPFKLVVHILLLPIAFCGVSF